MLRSEKVMTESEIYCLSIVLGPVDRLVVILPAAWWSVPGFAMNDVIGRTKRKTYHRIIQNTEVGVLRFGNGVCNLYTGVRPFGGRRG